MTVGNTVSKHIFYIANSDKFPSYFLAFLKFQQAFNMDIFNFYIRSHG